MINDPFANREAKKYVKPIPSREYIISYLKKHKTAESPVSLGSKLELQDEYAQEALQKRLKAMHRDGQLMRLRGGYYWLADELCTVSGIIIVDDEDYGYWLDPDDDSEPIFLSDFSKFVFEEGDQVIALCPNAIIDSEQFKEGRLVQIVNSKKRTMVGRLWKKSNFFVAIPQKNSVYNEEIIVDFENSKGAADKDIVVVEVIFSIEKLKNIGKVVEILGNEKNAQIEVDTALQNYNIPAKFPDNLKDIIEKYPPKLTNKDKEHRVDLSSIFFITIDGKDAKDFDDAVYCEKKRDSWRLLVAIADVSHYVKANTLLDSEAKLRGNSVYFPNRVIPMLPEVLSNNLCSLQPNVERLALVCEMNINKDGKISRYNFFTAIICSKARLTYTQVSELLNEPQVSDTNQELIPHIDNLHNLFKVLYKARLARGAIEFESKESKIIFNKKGKVSRIEIVVRTIAHRIIEECMLCANVAAARFLSKHKSPGLYRVHEHPSSEKLLELINLLNQLGIKTYFGDKVQPMDFANILTKVQNKDNASVIQTLLLRSMNQAIYTPENKGHFGLAYTAYVHFTSPIRRYPDLITHRIIKDILQNKENKISSEKLIELGGHCSITERRADDATRDVVKWLKCQYIERFIGDSFPAIISGITNFGIFAEITPLCVDGLIHVSTIGKEYFYFDAAQQILKGELTGKVFAIGDSIKVIVAKVDTDGRKIDLQLVNKINSKSKKYNKNRKKYAK